MANNNDARVLELKRLIDVKREKLGKAQKFIPITNCSLEIDGVRYNIHVLGKEQLIHLLVKLNSYAASAKELNLVGDYNISGHNAEDWITDLTSKLDHLSKKEKEQELKALEATLDRLLSDDKRVELELNGIAELLKGSL